MIPEVSTSAICDRHKIDRFSSVWIPGQGVRIDYAAIIEILIQQLDGDRMSILLSLHCRLIVFLDDEIQQSTALRWLAEFLGFASEVMVPFTPRLIPAVLPNLAHHVDMIQSMALRTNRLLLSVIQNLPPPSDLPPKSRMPASPTPGASTSNSRQSTIGTTSTKDSRDVSSPESLPEAPSPVPSQPTVAGLSRSRGSGADITMTPRPAAVAEMQSVAPVSRPHSPISLISTGQTANVPSIAPQEDDPFDYQATVNELTIQFLSEYEETRVAALKWLIMLHQKAPKKVRLIAVG